MTAHADSESGPPRSSLMRSATLPPAMYSIAIARRVDPGSSQQPRYLVTNGEEHCTRYEISRWMSSTSSSASSRSTSLTATTSLVSLSRAVWTSPALPRPIRGPSSNRSLVSAIPNCETIFLLQLGYQNSPELWRLSYFVSLHFS